MTFADGHATLACPGKVTRPKAGPVPFLYKCSCAMASQARKLSACAFTATGPNLRLCWPRMAATCKPLPESDFDFVMSIDLSAGADALRHAIHVGLDRLKPDGLAVYVFTLGIGHVRREEIERFSLDTIAFGHEVAQLKFGSRELRQNRANGIPFGLIIRRS
jgi:hypothetical protein